MNNERLEILLDRYFDEVLTLEERKELERMILASTQNRELFWERARLHGALRSWGESSWGPDDLPEAKPLEKVSPSKWLTPSFVKPLAWLAAAAILVGAIFVGSLLFDEPTPSPTATVGGIAVLTRTARAVWKSPEDARQAGQVLKPGWIRLQSGAVQIEFARGARVVLEGPGELELVKDNEAFLRFGKLRGFVPEPARGFQIRSGEFTLVDHGTEFGCNIPESGDPEVHVFNGKVEVQPTHSAPPPVELKDDQALRLSGGNNERIPANETAFLDERRLALLGTSYSRRWLEEWKLSITTLAKEPDMLVHLDFKPANEWDRALPNRAGSLSDQVAASLVGCEFDQGRLQGKTGIRFRGPEDRLRMQVPGKFASMTLGAWINVQDLSRLQHALVMTESFLPGELHWYIYRDGSIGMGIRVAEAGSPNEWQVFHSPPVVTPELLGHWVFVASVYDGESKNIIHYFNGREVGRRRMKVNQSLELNEFEIGNWAVRPDDEKWSGVKLRRKDAHICYFQGLMDELFIAKTAFSAEKISTLFEQGNPHELITKN